MSFTMENGVLKKYIEEEGVTSVSVPASVTVIGKKAFAGCQLTAVELPEGLTKSRTAPLKIARTCAVWHSPRASLPLAQWRFRDVLP